MTDARLHIPGIIFALIFHSIVVAAIYHHDEARGHAKRGFSFDESNTIEAALAFKAKKKKKKRRQPQKKKNRKVKPPAPIKISRDANRAPNASAKSRRPPPPDFIDPSSTFNKARSIDLDEPATDEGEDEEETGSDTGSEWGTAAEAKGDPYIGELHGRIKKVWKIPSLETGAGQALGCVRLTPEGRIAERKLWKKSDNNNLNRSVDQALRDATDMEEPVPPHLLHLLTKKGICFRFTLDV